MKQWCDWWIINRKVFVSAKIESELCKSLSLSPLEDKTLFLCRDNEGLSCTSPEIENVYVKIEENRNYIQVLSSEILNMFSLT